MSETAANLFATLVTAMEKADPQWKADRDKEIAEREAKRAATREAALEEFGSEEAVLAESDLERRLREALEPLADSKPFVNGGGTYVCGYAGWIVGTPPASVFAALEKAHPLPTTVEDAWTELKEWERRDEIAFAFVPEADVPIHVRARVAALEHLLDTIPAPTLDGIALRLEWMQSVAENEVSRDPEDDIRVLKQLRADVEQLRTSTDDPSSKFLMNDHT